MTQAQLAQGNAPLLAVRDVSVVFGGIIALNGVTFDMQKGQILGLIGPNGAGKTTLFNCLSRLYQPSSGDILMEGTSILTRPAHKIAEIGIGRTFQNVALFPNLTVLDNVRIGCHARSSSDIISDSIKLAMSRPVLMTHFAPRACMLPMSSARFGGIGGVSNSEKIVPSKSVEMSLIGNSIFKSAFAGTLHSACSCSSRRCSSSAQTRSSSRRTERSKEIQQGVHKMRRLHRRLPIRSALPDGTGQRSTSRSKSKCMQTLPGHAVH